ncbi:MAG: peptidase M20 [Acidobacteria bacterium]|nr:MAG: peptidase M20 [Acidobacteriota bacterium]
MNFKDLLRYCRAELPSFMPFLERTVKMESPTNSKPHVDALSRFLAQEFRRAGGRIRLLGHPEAGAAVLAEFWGEKRGAKPLLLLGHHDTVWDAGTLARMPYRVRGGRAFGPGILDMKAGIGVGLWAIRTLKALGIEPRGPVRFFLNSDEEVSSRAFRRQMEAEARRARAALVLEPAAQGGALKTSRKGVGEFRITVHGRSSHAGINPGAGVNAIAELARQLVRIEKFARPGRGLTLTVGTVQGGTRSNVVPERAWAAVDVRIPQARDQARIERQLHGLKPFHPEARLEVTGGINRPPMMRAMAADLFRRAQALGRELGMELREASTGGGSDGNFTAALGIPTLDGLGAVGDGAHAPHEHVIVRELPRRTALLAALLATL